MKFISSIVLICFIFTNIPVKGYANTANSYSLRRRAAEDERDSIKKIKDALENADQNNLSNLLVFSLKGSQEKGGVEAYSKLKQLALQSFGSLIDYFESLLPQAIASLPEDLFGKGYGYDIRGNALLVPKGIVDLTPVNCYILGKALGKMYARKGDKVLITGDQRWHTPVLRLATALGFISAGIDAEFSEEILGTGEHGLLSGENPYNHRIMIQVSGSHGVPEKNGEKIKIDKGEKGQIRLEPLYAQGLAEVFTKIKEKKIDFSVPEKIGNLKEISGLVSLAVDYLDKTLPQIDPEQPIIFDCRNSALIDVLKKIVEKRWLKNVRWFNDKPDPSMPGGIWDPSKSEALVLAKQELEKWNVELKSQRSKYRAVAFIFDGDGDRATAILEDGAVVPSFEMTLPFYQRFISDPTNKEVIRKLRKAGYTEKIWLACDIRATSALMSMVDAYPDYAGYYIQPGYPPQRDFVRWRIAELRKFVEANPKLLQSQEFMAGFQHFLNTYFTAEASGHQFFHICPNFPDKVIDAGIAVVFNLLYIKKTIPANEAKDDKLKSKLPPQDSFELVDLFKAFPVTISSEEARIVVPNLIKAKLEEIMAKKLKEKYKNELLLTKTGAEKVDDMIIQPKEEGAIEVEGIKVQLKSGGSAMFKKSNTGEQAVLIFEGSTPEELNQIMLDTEGLIKEAVGELAKGAAGNEKIIEACKNVNLDDLRNKRAKAIEKYSVPKARGVEEKSLPTIFEQLEKIYEERGAGMDDYYVPPIVVVDPKGEPVAKVKKGDVVIFANHRSDRAREALYALTDTDFNKKGNRFDTENLGVTFVPFNVYDKEYFKAHGIQAAFTSESTLPPYKSIIEVLHQAGVVQGYFTESDKGQHVTHFFAGQRDLDYASLGIEVSVISSEGVKDEKKDPRMKYEQITNNVINYLNKIKDISKKKIIVVNLPVDIQGHNIKGNKERAIKTVLAADEAAGRIREAILSQNGVYIETSDHGNIEKLATLDDNGMPVSDKYGVIPFDEHTTNPVNFIIDGLGKDIKLKQGKGLANIAATLLEISGIPKPEAMEESLLLDYQYQGIEGPIILVIRDGWGVNPFENQEAKEYNGIELAQPPVFLDLLNNCPHTILKAHGDAVGLPDYQMGDSDNGHRVIGTGFNPPTLYKQIIDQIEKGTFFQNPVLLQAFETAKKENSNVHIMGLYSSGGIHSDNRFFLALMEMAKKANFSGKVNLWPFLDGRDVMTRVPTENGIFYLKQIQDKIAELNSPNIQLAGTIGRNFAMDRDGINVDIAADKKEKLAGTKTGKEADKLIKEANKSREENKLIWEERFKLAYRLWVYGEGIPVRLGLENGEKKTNVQAEVDNIIANSNGKIKVGLFDIGGVLLDCPKTKVINNFQKAIKNKFGEEISKEEIEELIYIGKSAQKLRADLPIEDFVDELNNYLQAKFNPEVKFELKEYMGIHFFNYEPPAGMVELVRNLRDKGLSIYVISNNFISNRFNLKEMFKDKLNSYYSKPGEQEIFNDENLIMSNEIGFAKPNSMAFNKALEEINSGLKSDLNPENVLFIDDQWENAGSAKLLGYNVAGLNEEVSGLLNFFDANSRFFKAVGGETAFREYLENILLLYQTLKPERFSSGSKLTLIVHSSFFRIGGALDALNAIIKMKSGDGKPFVKIGIYGEGAAKLKSLLGDSSDVATADSAEKLIKESKKENVDYQEEIAVLRPIGEKIETDVKQIGFSEKTISTVAVAKAMQALTGMDVSGEYKNEAISYAFKEFYRQERDKGIISNEIYENTKEQLSSTLELPPIELAPGVSEATKEDAGLIFEFIDSFI